MTCAVRPARADPSYPETFIYTQAHVPYRRSGKIDCDALWSTAVNSLFLL